MPLHQDLSNWAHQTAAAENNNDADMENFDFLSMARV